LIEYYILLDKYILFCYNNSALKKTAIGLSILQRVSGLKWHICTCGDPFGAWKPKQQ